MCRYREVDFGKPPVQVNLPKPRKYGSKGCRSGRRTPGKRNCERPIIMVLAPIYTANARSAFVESQNCWMVPFAWGLSQPTIALMIDARGVGSPQAFLAMCEFGNMLQAQTHVTALRLYLMIKRLQNGAHRCSLAVPAAYVAGNGCRPMGADTRPCAR